MTKLVGFARLAFILFVCVVSCTAAESAAVSRGLLRSNDVICLVGGANVVSSQQYGYLETLLRLSYPHRNLRIRSLGHEGDTVYEQPRDYNYPTIEKQLTQYGATVVLAQFGQMEFLDRTKRLPQFISSYDKFINDLSRNGRRVILLSPFPFERPNPRSMWSETAANNDQLRDWVDAIKSLAARHDLAFVDLFSEPAAENRSLQLDKTTDGVHLNALGHWKSDRILAHALGANISAASNVTVNAATGALTQDDWEPIRQAVIEKNWLWFNYYRPMNWAFLGGDRTDQPSSRDHVNPKIRWFPDEMKKFEPLIDHAETEIAALVATTGGAK